MPDSGITKKVLASALKELMIQQPFAKISIGNICEQCDMNRKSFYYHFKDKYELVNWIFDTEFLSVVNFTSVTYPDGMSGRDYMRELLMYLHENRGFYRAALQIDGQNSFHDHFRETLGAIFAVDLERPLTGDEEEDFYIHFITDGFISAIERWLLDKSAPEPDIFITRIRSVVRVMAEKILSDPL